MAIWDNEDIGKRIRRLREERGLTQEGLARATGLSENTIAKLETGMIKTVAEYYGPLAKALGTTADRLLNGESHAVRQSMKIVADNRRAWQVTEEEERKLLASVDNLVRARSNDTGSFNCPSKDSTMAAATPNTTLPHRGNHECCPGHFAIRMDN